MDTIYKLILFLLVVFFLINNAKDGKALNDEEMFDTYSYTNEPQQTFILD